MKNDETKKDYYTLERLDEIPAQYKIIFGQRSNGKTFAVQERIIDNYIKNGEQGAIIRRYELDFKSRRGVRMFEHFVNNPNCGNIICEKTRGEWEDIYYYGGEWYLCKYTEHMERVKDTQPFCYSFSISGAKHDKSTSYPNVTTILFDEFIDRDGYLPDEFTDFTNLLSTIIRDRDNVTIYMCGNTVNKYNNLYFTEMGLTHVSKMNAGDIATYKLAVSKNRELIIAVEYSDNFKNGKPSDIYFAFDNPKLKMITNGLWEIALYPHLPYKYKNDNILLTYFIIWENIILQCEIICIEENKTNIYFTYIHKKTTPLKNDNTDIIFSTDYNAKLNYRRRITQPIDTIAQKIYYFYRTEKVFYQDNEIGEIVRNYLQWCITDRGIQ